MVSYTGIIREGKDVRRLEKELDNEDWKNQGSYVLFFKFKGKKMCIDATSETGEYGRLLNHSITPNLKPHLLEFEERPIVVFKALRDIRMAEELCWNYGETRSSVIRELPWLKTSL